MRSVDEDEFMKLLHENTLIFGGVMVNCECLGNGRLRKSFKIPGGCLGPEEEIEYVDGPGGVFADVAIQNIQNRLDREEG